MLLGSHVHACFFTCSGTALGAPRPEQDFDSGSKIGEGQCGDLLYWTQDVGYILLELLTASSFLI